MAERTIAEIMEEGQKLTLEQVELSRKELLGTITPEEKARLATLNGYLLGLVGEAQAKGVGVAVGTGYGQTPEVDTDEEDEDLFAGLDEDEVDEYGDPITPEANEYGDRYGGQW